jgi:hypothetical protein
VRALPGERRGEQERDADRSVERSRAERERDPGEDRADREHAAQAQRVTEEHTRADQRVERLRLHADGGVDRARALRALEEEQERERGAERTDGDQHRRRAPRHELAELPVPGEHRECADARAGAGPEGDREAARVAGRELRDRGNEGAVHDAARREEQSRALVRASQAALGFARSKAATTR